jgi:hypothetical protein
VGTLYDTTRLVYAALRLVARTFAFGAFGQGGRHLALVGPRCTARNGVGDDSLVHVLCAVARTLEVVGLVDSEAAKSLRLCRNIDTVNR